MASDKLARLIEQRKAVDERIKLEQNKRKAVERRMDTRRKVLAGALALNMAEKDKAFSARLNEELGRFLVRDSERALFGLPPLKQPETQDA